MKIKVLLIEDDSQQALFIKKILRNGFDFYWADSLEKGLDILSNIKIDIVLLDLILPDSRGIDTFSKVHTYIPNLPIIVLSGLNDEEIALSAVKNGAQDYLVKGMVDAYLLARAINYAIERKKNEVALRESQQKYKELATALQKSKEKYRRLFEEIKKVNKKLEESNKKLKLTQASMIQQEKLASIGQLAAGVAHELNNPLGFIANNFDTLKNYIKHIDQYIIQLEKLIPLIKNKNNHQLLDSVIKIENFRKQRKIDFIFQDINDLFSESTKGFERIMAIVQSLRNFSRIDFNKEMECYNINAAIEDTLIVARNEIKYVATVEKKLMEVPLIECKGDEINQVLLNILTNAAQAIGSQNQTKQGKITIKTYANEEYVYCEITDDGPGIPPQIIDKIFDPFFTTKEVGKGTGLGLSISYDIIVNKHKGDLTVKSKLGEGTTFIIKLPIRSPFLMEAKQDVNF